MNQLRSFLPWIVYPVVSAALGWRLGAAVALAACVFALARGGRSASTDVFTVAAVVFFGALAALAFADPASGVHRFVPALTPAVLAVAAAASIVAGRPFTVVVARRVAPPEFWDTPMFVHINVVLSAVWAASFAVTAAVIAIVLAVAPQAAGILIATQVAGFVVPMRISRRYPATVRARYAPA